MKTTEFNSTITSAQLKENMNKMFNVNVNLDKYTREQLEDMRNKLRTRVFQQEGKAGINDLLTNETYQKDKAMLDLLNTRIKEMLGENIKQLRDKMVELSEAKKGVRAPKHTKKAKGAKADKDYDGDGKIESPKDEVWGSRAKAAAKAGKSFEEGADTLAGRVGMNAVNKKPRDGQTNLKNIPAGNYPGSQNKFTDRDKELQRAQLKKDIKAKAGTHKKPALPEEQVEEGWDDMMKAAKERGQPQPNGGAGKKQGSRYGGSKQKDEKETKESTGDYSAKKARAGKDIGKPGKNFEKIAKSAGKQYGSKEKGEKVAGAVLAKLRKESFKNNVRMINEGLNRYLLEDEEGKAKAITAAGDMVNDYTSWMQRVGQYQTKTMIELADAIKADFGAAEAEAFKQAVAPALEETLAVLTAQREAISNAVAVLAGEEVAQEPMGQEPDMMPSPEMDVAAPDEMNAEPAADEFGAADAAAGAGTTGREMRESKFARKLAESHSIMAKLSK